MELFAVSLADIQKTLRPKKRVDLKELLSKFYQDKDYFDLFIKTDSKGLPLLKKSGINHEIKLEKINRRDIEVLWDSLYNISREELLVLKKELIRLLDKRFIRVSKSAIRVSVLFIYKPDEGLRFCINYRALNKITRKDCYPLSLIQKILHQLNKTKWFIKLDISIAFHKLKIYKKNK